MITYKTTAMKKTNILILGFLIISAANFAQRSNIWHFGYGASVDFSSGSPVGMLGSQINTIEGCASICDESGNLLFYTDGQTVWDKNNSQMPNGTGLYGSGTSTQSAIIVPKPGSTTEYYIFTVDWPDYYDSGVTIHGINYSIVDMTMNSGDGDVSVKNQMMLDPYVNPSAEKITAIMHSNNTDYWVIAHGWNDNNFYSWLVTSSGVQSSPIVTSVGLVHEDVGSGAKTESHGYMKTSPDGTWLGLAIQSNINKAELFEFDRATGIPSNPVTLNVASGGMMSGAYGLEFSPNSEVLYVSRGNKISQWDLTAGSAAAIASSRNTITIPGASSRWAGALQLALDDKIYVAINPETYLHVINNPNALGASCNYQDSVVDLLGEENRMGLPTFFPAFFSDELQITAGSQPPTCPGDCDGEANVVPLNGKAPYQYE